MVKFGFIGELNRAQNRHLEKQYEHKKRKVCIQRQIKHGLQMHKIAGKHLPTEHTMTVVCEKTVGFFENQ